MIDCSALPRCRRKTRVGRDLPPVVEMAGEPLGPEHSGKLRSDAFQVEQERRRWCGDLHGYKHSIPRLLDFLDLRQQQFDAIELATNLRFQMEGQRTTVTSPQLLQFFASIAARRLLPRYALTEEKALYAVDVPYPLIDQRLALARDPAAVFLLGRRRSNHVQTRGSPRL